MKHEIIGGQLTLPDGTQLPISKAARAGDFVFLSGQLALDENGRLHGQDIETQTRQCIENIQALLRHAGCELSDVVKATVWIVERADFAGFNTVYAEYFATQPPTRSTVCSQLMLPGAKIEIEVTAYHRA